MAIQPDTNHVFWKRLNLMLTFTEVLLALAAVIGVAYLIGNQKSLEMANFAARRFCQQNHLQLLDGTVSRTAVRFSKSSLALSRHYRFEYSMNSINRYQGTIAIIGRTQSVYIHPDHLANPGQPVEPRQVSN